VLRVFFRNSKKGAAAASHRLPAAGCRGCPSGGEELIEEEVAGEEVAGEEVAGEELAGEEAVGEEVAGEELAGEEVIGEELTREKLGRGGACQESSGRSLAAGRSSSGVIGEELGRGGARRESLGRSLVGELAGESSKRSFSCSCVYERDREVEEI
jgi:hypothetical protein